MSLWHLTKLQLPETMLWTDSESNQVITLSVALFSEALLQLGAMCHVTACAQVRGSTTICSISTHKSDLRVGTRVSP